MRAFLKKKIERLLLELARLTLKKYEPLVVGVTGSIGKSSAKEAIALVLAKQFTVRKSSGNYNNEFGVPLTVFGEESPRRQAFGWFAVIWRALLGLVFHRPFPQAIVLEMGIDRPGDMAYLLEFVRPSIGVATNVSGSHLAFFGTLGNIAKEKGKLIAMLPESGTAVLNADDERVMKMAERTKARVITYGFSEVATVRAEHLQLLQEGSRVDGISFKLSFDGKSIPVRLPEMLGKHQVSAVLAAAAVGIAAKMNLVDIAEALLSYRTLPGRLTLLPGRSGMRIVDDTYNASPASTRAALAVLRELIAPRRVVILGDMLELGPSSPDEHRALAEAVIGSGATIFVGVGRYMQFLADALRATNFPQKYIYAFADPLLAREALSDILRPEDLVLVKGSQGLRMELIVAALLRDETEAGQWLCRQSESWRAKPFTPPTEWPV